MHFCFQPGAISTSWERNFGNQYDANQLDIVESFLDANLCLLPLVHLARLLVDGSMHRIVVVLQQLLQNILEFINGLKIAAIGNAVLGQVIPMSICTLGGIGPLAIGLTSRQPKYRVDFFWSQNLIK